MTALEQPVVGMRSVAGGAVAYAVPPDWWSERLDAAPDGAQRYPGTRIVVLGAHAYRSRRRSALGFKVMSDASMPARQPRDGDDLDEGAWRVDDVAALRRFWPHGRFYSSDLERFSGEVFRRRLPRTRIEGISASPYACHRSEEVVSAPSGDQLVVSAIIEGSATIRGRGRTLEVRPGDVFVHRLTPFEYRCPVYSRTFRTASPPSLLMGQAWAGFAPFAVLPRTVLTHAFVRFAAEVLHSVAERPSIFERSAQVLEEALLVLERALVSELVEAEAGLLANDERLRLLTERHIETNLLEPNLNPSSIADALAVGRRSLYSAFRDEPEGIACSIRRRRMEVAGAILEREDAIGVAHLASRVGISNPDTFARAFKAHHGLTVAQARQRARLSKPVNW